VEAFARSCLGFQTIRSEEMINGDTKKELEGEADFEGQKVCVI